MDITLALQRAVRGYPGGTAAMAAILGISEASLRHKLSPTYPGAHCSPEEALVIMEHTGDHGALFAQGAALRYVMIPVPPEAAADDAGMLALAGSVREFGEFVAEAAGALADGRITRNELARLESEGAQALAAIQQLLRVAQGLHVAPPVVALAGGRR